MQRHRLVRKWSEEETISAQYARFSDQPVKPALVHDDGRFRIWDAGGVFFLAGEITEPRPTLYKSATGWQALEPRLSDLALELNKLFPDKLPGKSSSTRTRVMRNMVGLTPKGFGLGDTALWLGLTAKKDFDPAQPRDEDGKWTSGRPGTGPDRPGAEKLLEFQKSVRPLARMAELGERYKDEPEFQALALAKAVADEFSLDEEPTPLSPMETMDAIRASWYSDVMASPLAAAMQSLVQEKFKLPGSVVPSAALKDYGSLLKQLVDDTYADTQAFLAEKGITEVEVVRGLRGIPAGLTPGRHEDVAFQTNPLSSWTTLMEKTNNFVSTPGAVLKMRVPASKIFSIGGHGVIGQAGEAEVVTIGDHLTGEAWAWTAESGERPEGVWKMTLTINPDEDPANANWLHTKKPSLREQVAKALGDEKFDEEKHNRDEDGKFAPKGGAPEAPKPLAPSASPTGYLPPSLARRLPAGPPSLDVTQPNPKLSAPTKEPAKPWTPTAAEMRPPKYPIKPFGAQLGSIPLANGSTFSVEEGDLLGAPVDAIVNPANEDLSHGGGVAGAIRKNGGYIVQVLSDNWIKKHGKATPKKAAATGAGSLPQKLIIHAVAPIYGDGTKGEAADMESAYFSAMRLAHLNSMTSLAFPSLGTGIFGNPLSLGTASALKAAQRFAVEFPDSPLKAIHIVVRPEDKDTHEAFGNMINGRPVIDKPKPVTPDPAVWTRDWKDPKDTRQASGSYWGKDKPKPKPQGRDQMPLVWEPKPKSSLPPVPKGGVVDKPLIDMDDSETIMGLADFHEINGGDKGKDIAMDLGNLEAALFRGNHDLALNSYRLLPREVREALPGSVTTMFEEIKPTPQAEAPKPVEPPKPEHRGFNIFEETRRKLSEWGKGKKQ